MSMYVLVAVVWMWLLGATMMGMLLQEMFDRVIVWRAVVGCLLWPVAWPSVLAYWVASEAASKARAVMGEKT